MIANYLRLRPRILMLIIGVIVVAGVTSMQVIPRLEDPTLTSRFAISTVVLPGGTLQQVESLVTGPLERALFEIPEIAQVRSNTGPSVSRIVIELKEEITQTDAIWAKIRNQLHFASDQIPDACEMSPLQVVPLKAFAAILAVQSTATNQSTNSSDSPQTPFARLRPIAERLRTELIRIPGTQRVKIIGDPGEEYVVESDPAKLAKYGLSSVNVARQLGQAIGQRPAGSINSRSTRLTMGLRQQNDAIKTIGETKLLIAQSPDRIPVADLASIRRQLVSPPTEMAIIDGQKSIVVAAMVDDGRRLDRWAQQLGETIEQFRGRLPEHTQIKLLFSQADHVDSRITQLVKSLLMGTIAVTVVVWFMLGWRAMVVVAIALPLSAMMVIFGMRLLEIPIHQMSVTGLIVALGLLIDNAIVMVDSIRARQLRGEDTASAISGSIRLFAIPLFVSTLTTAMAFMPIAMLPGASGEFVGAIATSVILAIFSSFLLSMTVIPAMMGWIGVKQDSPLPIQQQITDVYRLMLGHLFRHPGVGVLLGLIFPIAGVWAWSRLPEQFFPPSDRPQIQVEVEQVASDSIASTRQAVERVQKLLGESPAVRHQYWFLGQSAPSFFYNVLPRRQNTPFYAQAFVDITLGHGDSASQLAGRLQEKVNRVATSRVVVRPLQQGPPIEAPIELRIVGDDLNTLRRSGQQIRRMLSRIPEVTSTRSDLGETVPRLSLRVDEAAAERVGLDRKQVSGFLYASLEGASAGELFNGHEKLPIRVTLADNGVPLANRVLAMPVAASTVGPNNPSLSNRLDSSTFQPQFDTPIPLADLVSVEMDSGLGAIVHQGGQRINEVKAYVAAGVLPSVVLSKLKRIMSEENFQLPEGCQLVFGGESAQRTEAIGQLVSNAVVLCSLMVLALVLSFQSLRGALIVASVAGLSVCIAPLVLWVFGYPLGFMAILGAMGLVGIAINDSIVVLAAIQENRPGKDQTNRLNCRGGEMDYCEPVIDSTRHILATTLTTIVGFLPLVLAGGGFWPPLAITISAGITGATFLALVVTPCLHMLLHRRDEPIGQTSPNESPVGIGNRRVLPAPKQSTL